MVEEEFNQEYFSPDWFHIEDLLKTHAERWQNAKRTIAETDCYIKPDGSVDCKNDLIDTMASGVQQLKDVRVQSTQDGDSQMINIVNMLDKQLSYSNDSVKRRREKAFATIKELELLAECVDELPPKMNSVIANRYYAFEIEADEISGKEVMKPIRYELAVNLSGYKSSSGFEPQRKKAISLLVVAMRKKKSESRNKKVED